MAKALAKLEHFDDQESKGKRNVEQKRQLEEQRKKAGRKKKRKRQKINDKSNMK